jgi:hypothetical protein
MQQYQVVTGSQYPVATSKGVGSPLDLPPSRDRSGGAHRFQHMHYRLRERFPHLPEIILWKAELMFGGLRFTEALARAVEDGAAPNFYPYRRKKANGLAESVPVPYLFDLGGKAVARIRVDDRAHLEVRRDDRGRYTLWGVEPSGEAGADDGAASDPAAGAASDPDAGRLLTDVSFVRQHTWSAFRTDDGLDAFGAGAEQLGDMIVVNVAPGCEYFTVRGPTGQSQKCTYCAYGRFDKRSNLLGQKQGEVVLDELIPRRIEAVMRAAAADPAAGHVYITGGSMLDPKDEVERFLPVVEAVRRGVGDRLRVTIGSGAVDRDGSQRFKDAGADSANYNLEVWDPATFAACCPGKSQYVGRERWIQGLVDAVEVFGRGNVGSAFVAGLELVPPGPGMSHEQFLASVLEGATFLLDRGIAPLYSPLWPIDGTAYGLNHGIPPHLYVQLQHELYKLRAERQFPVPGWLICPHCSFMLLEVDFDRAFGLEEACAPTVASPSV